MLNKVSRDFTGICPKPNKINIRKQTILAHHEKANVQNSVQVFKT